MTSSAPALDRPTGSRTVPTILLRLEAALVAAAAIAAYAHLDGGAGLYFAVWLIPDLAMLGYVGGARWGAACYNSTHSLALPLGLMAWGHLGGSPLLVQLGLVWVSHIGIDRALGYGLKYRDGFHHTHFTRT